MDKATIIKALNDARNLDEPTNTLVGCVQCLRQCDYSLSGWLSRKDRRRHLRKLHTKAGQRALLDLIDLTISVIEAAVWVDDYWVGALPTGREPRRLSDAHKAALQAGRAAARKKQETRRQNRLTRELDSV